MGRLECIATWRSWLGQEWKKMKRFRTVPLMRNISSTFQFKMGSWWEPCSIPTCFNRWTFSQWYYGDWGISTKWKYISKQYLCDKAFRHYMGSWFLNTECFVGTIDILASCGATGGFPSEVDLIGAEAEDENIPPIIANKKRMFVVTHRPIAIHLERTDSICHKIHRNQRRQVGLFIVACRQRK